jgi:hypothetical protein
MQSAADILSRKIHSLTSEQLAKVEALIASLQADDQTHASLSLSEHAFAEVWNHPENDIYDGL